MPSWVDDGTADSPASHLAADGTAKAGDSGQAERQNGAGGDVVAEINHGPFGVWGPAGPALAQWRPGLLSVAAAAAAIVLLLAAGWMVERSNGNSATDVDWSDPNSVATDFVERYAVHDPAACELVTSALRGRLEGEGRCAGPVRGTPPRVAVIDSQTCGSVHNFDAVVTPEGEVGKRFVALGLERGAGVAWLVRSVLPIGDCRVLVPQICEGRR